MKSVSQDSGHSHVSVRSFGHLIRAALDKPLNAQPNHASPPDWFHYVFPTRGRVSAAINCGFWQAFGKSTAQNSPKLVNRSYWGCQTRTTTSMISNSHISLTNVCWISKTRLQDALWMALRELDPKFVPGLANNSPERFRWKLPATQLAKRMKRIFMCFTHDL